MEIKSNNTITDGLVRAAIDAQRQSDEDYTNRINATLDRWVSFLDLCTRSVGVFTLTMMTYIDERIARFFDREHYPEYAALGVREGKKALREMERFAADLRRNCAPQINNEWWPIPAVREAISRYKKQGIEHDFIVLHCTMRNYFFKQGLDLPEPLYDLYLCSCLVRLIDINVDSYSRALIDIDPLFADILNLPDPAADTADEGKRTPLHLMADADTRLHVRLAKSDPKLHRELSHRRFARTRPLRLAISRAANLLYGHLSISLPDSGQLMADKELSPVGQAAVILLNRANKTDFIRRATEPKAWADFDAIEKDYLAWLDDNDRDHSLEAAREWKLQSEKCGESVAAKLAVKKFEEQVDDKCGSPAARWLDVTTSLEDEWVEHEAECRRAFDIERDAMAKLHPDWTPEKVERAVAEIQYGAHEASLMYDVVALRHHLELVRPKGVTKKALQHERAQRRKAEKQIKSKKVAMKKTV